MNISFIIHNSSGKYNCFFMADVSSFLCLVTYFFFYFIPNFHKDLRIFIYTLAHQRIINICHRYDLCRNWNLFSGQTIRIPFTIITLMMPSADLVCDLDHLLILIMLQLIQHRSTNQRMLFHSLKFFFSQLSRQRISSSTYGFSSTSI